MDDDGHLDDDARAWVQQLADEQYGGNFGRAAAAVIEAAHARMKHPDDPWAESEAQVRSRRDDKR